MLYLPLVFWTIICLFLPGYLLLHLFQYRRIAGASYIDSLLYLFPLSFGLSVSIIAFAGWLSYFLNWTFIHVQTIVLVTLGLLVLAVFITKWGRIQKAGSLQSFLSVSGTSTSYSSSNLSEETPVRNSILWYSGIWVLAVAATIIAVATGVWFSHTADSFGHISAIRSLLQYNNPLPQEIFFPVPVKEMSPIFGTWNLAMALVANLANSDLLIAWRFFNHALTPFLVLAFASLGILITRRWDAAFLSTLLFLLFQQKLDFRSLAYPNKAGQILMWMTIFLVIHYASVHLSSRSTSRDKSSLVLIGVLAFGTSTVHMQYAPVLMLLLAMGVAISFFDRIWDPFIEWVRKTIIERQSPDANNINRVSAYDDRNGLQTQSSTRLRIRSLLLKVFGWRFLHAAVIAMTAALIPFAYKTLQMLSSPRVRITETAASDIDSIDVSLWLTSFEPMIPLLSALVIGVFVIWKRNNIGSAFLLGAALSVPFFVIVSHIFVGMGGTWNTIIERLVRLVPAILFVWLGWQIVESLTLIWGNIKASNVSYGTILSAIVLFSSLSFSYQALDGLRSLYSPDSTYKFKISASINNDLTVIWKDAISALQALPDDSIIFSDLSTSYMLNGLTGKRVVSLLQQHTSLWDKDTNNIGIFDVMDFTAGRLDPAAEMNALQKNGVTHVFVSKNQTPALWDYLQSVTALELTAEGADWRLYQFRPEKVDEYLVFVAKRERASSPTELIELFRNSEELFSNREQYADAAALYLKIPETYIVPFLAQGDNYSSPLSPGTYYDFLGNLDRAERSSPDDASYIRRTSFIVNYRPFGVLFQHAPSEVTFDLTVPPNSVFSFSPVIAPDVWQYGKGDGVQFTIYLTNRDDLRYTLYDEYLDPKNVVDQRKVITRLVDLSRWAGQDVRITFATGCGPNDNCDFDWAGWKEPRITQPVYYDFLEDFASALPSASNGENGHVDVLEQTINYDTRRILYQHPTSRVTFSVFLPERAVLQFGLGMAPEVWTAENSDGAVYNIYVRDPEEPFVTQRVYHRIIDPQNNLDDRRWFDERVDLSAFGGKEVEIIFEALPGPADNYDFDWGGWSSPVIIDETGPGSRAAYATESATITP